MTQESEEARDPRYDVNEDGKLVPHSENREEFRLEFEGE
jgi:hypothetical protein